MIRDATAQDEAAFRALWADYLAFYRLDLAPGITDFTWARILDPSVQMGLRLAEPEGAVTGFALYTWHPSSWSPADDCYLEDLFVAEPQRGHGLGRALIEDLIALARARGWARLYWMTEETNARARTLYDQYAATDGHIRYRMRL